MPIAPHKSCGVTGWPWQTRKSWPGYRVTAGAGRTPPTLTSGTALSRKTRYSLLTAPTAWCAWSKWRTRSPGESKDWRLERCAKGRTLSIGAGGFQPTPRLWRNEMVAQRKRSREREQTERRRRTRWWVTGALALVVRVGSLEVSATEIDLGEVPAGRWVSPTFRLRNVGAESVTITVPRQGVETLEGC